MGRHRARALAFAVALFAAAFGAGCAVAIDPAAIQDAQTVARVKTALVNDPALGGRALEVRVTRGVAELSGRVLSTDELQRTITVVRGVPGITGVVVTGVLVGEVPETPVGAEPLPSDPASELREIEGDRRLLALGASVSTSQPAADELSPRWAVGFLVRVGAGEGLGPVVGFSWFRAAVGDDSASRVRVRPVLAGIGYTVRRGPLSVATSIAGGYAFNSVSGSEGPGADGVAVAVDNSFVLRPGVSLWHDLNRRVALNLSLNYVLTELGVTFLEDGALRKRDVSGNTAVIQAGLAYKLF